MLEQYQAMVSLSRRMLEAARLADWAQLIELGQERDAVEARLHARQDGVPPYGAAGGEQEQELVSTLLAANEQIRLLVETQLASLHLTDQDGAGPA